MKNFSIGEYIIYVNGDKYEIGRIKSICDDGAFVAYHEAEAKANELLKKSLSDEVLRQMYIDKWDGTLPKVQSGSNMMLDVGGVE